MFKDTLAYWMDKKRIGINELGRMSGVGQSTISELLSGKIKDTTTEKALAFCKALGITPNNLLLEIKEQNEYDNKKDKFFKFFEENASAVRIMAKIASGNLNDSEIMDIEKQVDFIIFKKNENNKST